MVRLASGVSQHTGGGRPLKLGLEFWGIEAQLVVVRFDLDSTPQPETRMEVVVFSGLQGSGKSTWFFEHYSSTHLRICLDVVGTRNREASILHACLAVGQRVVIDNTNVTARARSRYAHLQDRAFMLMPHNRSA